MECRIHAVKAWRPLKSRRRRLAAKVRGVQSQWFMTSYGLAGLVGLVGLVGLARGVGPRATSQSG